MKRLKKLFAAGLMTVVTGFACVGSAVANFAKAFFSFGSVNAAVGENKNTNTDSLVVRGKIVTVSNFPSTENLERGTKIDLPYLGKEGEIFDVVATDAPSASASTAFATGDHLYAEITNPYGVKLTKYDDTVSSQAGFGKTAVAEAGQGQVSYNETSKKLELTPAIAGTYKVQYYVMNADRTWTSSPVYELSVQKTTYGMEMVENSATVMPSTVKVVEASTKVTVGLPLVYDKEGNLVTDDIVLGDKFAENGEDYYYVAKYESRATETNTLKLGEVTNVSLSDTVQNTYAEYKTYYVRKVKASDYDASADKARYKLYVEAGNQTNATVTGTKTALNFVDASKVTTEGVAYDLNAYEFNASKGINSIQYKLCMNNDSATPAKPETYLTRTIEGKSTYDNSEVELGATPAKKFLSTDLEYGEKTYLPKVSAVDLKNNKSSVNAFYYYTVKVKTKDGYSVEKVTMGKDEKGFYFIPMAATGSTYEIYYNVRDFYGNTVEDDDNADYPNHYQVSITDRKSPTVSFARSFNGLATDISTEDLTDYSYSIPTKVKIGDTIAVPAIYASDNSGLSSITRSIQSKDKTFKSTKEGETTSTNVSGTIYLTRQDGTTATSSGFTLGQSGSTINDIVKFSDVSYENGFKVVNNEFTKQDGTTFENDEYMRAKNSQVAFVKIDGKVFGKGTYTLTLNATDKALNSNSSSRTYTFEVVEDDVDFGTPTVTYGKSTVNNVTKDQEFKIAVPKISDNQTTNPLVRYYAVVTNGANVTYHQLSLDDSKSNIVVKMNETIGETNKTLYELAAETTSRNFEIRAYVMNYGSKFYETNRVTLAGATKAQAEELILNWFKENYDAKADEEKDKSVAMASYKISLKNLDDKEAPVFVNETGTIFDQNTVEVEQFKEIEVNGVKFTDNTSSAYVYAEVRDSKGNIYDYSERGSLVIKEVGGKYEYTFPGIKFTPTNADKENYYTVTYMLQDRGGNTVSYSVVLVQAKDKQAPVISGVDNSDATIELGETLNLYQIVATDNQSSEGEITLNFEVKDQNGKYVNSWCNDFNRTFTPEAVGTYTVSVSATDKDGNTSTKSSFTVKVQDTLKPVINLIGDTTDEISYSEDDIATAFPQVSIPTFTVADQKPENSTVTKGGIFGATGSIKLSAPTKGSDNKSEYEYDMQGKLKDGKDRFNFTREGDMFKFTPDARGTYTITYTATDNNGNKAENEKTITIRVGDTEAPQIILTSSLKNILDAGFVLGENTTLKINTNARIYSESNYDSEHVYLKDNVAGIEGFNCKEYKNPDDESEVLYHYYTVGVTITDGNSSRVSSTSDDNGYMTFNFKSAGTYTITFTATDKAGNNETWSRQFKVVAPDSTTSEKTTIIGTILIVISAIVLAGVVLYFIKGTKIAKNRKKGKKVDNKKNDKIEA